MKRPKKRFNSREEILAEIDRWKAKAQRLMERAASFDLTADEFAKYGSDNPNDIPWHREKAKACRKSVYRIEKDRLSRLKQKLSEFETKPMKGIVDDPSIQR